MFTTDATLLKIQSIALQEATKDWDEERRRDLSKRAFREVVTNDYNLLMRLPSFNVQIREQ